MIVGTEWLIEAIGCNPTLLRDESAIKAIMSQITDDLGLKTVGSVWYKFGGEGGVTGLIALTESHLACHTYPEYGIATFNLYCCRTRPEWDWEARLKTALGALAVSITKIERGNSVADNRTVAKGNTGKSSLPQSEIQNLKSHVVGGDA